VSRGDPLGDRIKGSRRFTLRLRVNRRDRQARRFRMKSLFLFLFSLSFCLSLSLSLSLLSSLSVSLCILREECKVILYMWRLSSISSILHNETKRCSIKDGTRRLVTFFIENRSGNVRINFIQYHNVVFSRELIFTVSFISTLFKLAASS